MIFVTSREERAVRRYPAEFVEIQVRIPRWVMAKAIEDVLRNP